MKRKISIIKSLSICLLLVAATLMFNTTAFTSGAAAAGTPDSCTQPATTYGTDTMSVYVPETTTYTIWTRMQAPSSSANSILLNIDNTNCYNVGGDSSIPTNNSWTWVDDYGGSTSNIINLSLTQGTHTFTLVGTESGVSIDRVIAIQGAANCNGSSSCTPSNTQDDTAGNNIAPIDNTSSGPPAVSITAPTSGTVSGTTTITANAVTADPANTQEGIASVEFLLNGSPLPSTTGNPNPVVAPTSGSTYDYSWATSGTSTGDSLTAIATDDSGSTNTSSAVSVAVDNSTGSIGGLTTPTGLHVITNAGRSITLAWNGSTDTVSGGPAVQGYHIYLNGSTTPLTSVTGTTYTDSGLTPGTAYSYSVAAYDSATTGNVSTLSNVVNDTTCIAGDINCDGVVNLSDLTILGQHWGATGGATWAQGDLSGDGNINLTDLTILGQNWGK